MEDGLFQKFSGLKVKKLSKAVNKVQRNVRRCEVRSVKTVRKVRREDS